MTGCTYGAVQRLGGASARGREGRFTSHPAPERDNFDFFDVQLFTPAEERLRPCSEAVDNLSPATWRRREYCLKSGTEFELRMTLRRATGEQRWGGRVLVNCGDMLSLHVEDDGNGSSAAFTPNHTFWFGAGAREFVDTGFYEGGGVSRRYVVGKSTFASAGTNPTLSAAKRRNAAVQLGSIRVQFAPVTHVKSAKQPRRAGMQYTTPQLPYMENPKEREAKSREFSHVVASGKRVVEDFDEEKADLSPDTVFEWCIRFVHFAQLANGTISLRAFGSLPLSLFAEMPEVRLRLLNQALSDLQRTNLPRAEGAPSWAALEPDAYNPFVTVSDLVHHISRLVSPAASYYACVGSFRHDRYVRALSRRRRHCVLKGLCTHLLTLPYSCTRNSSGTASATFRRSRGLIRSATARPTSKPSLTACSPSCVRGQARTRWAKTRMGTQLCGRQWWRSTEPAD